MNSADPYLASKMKVLDHIRGLIEIMSFKFQTRPKPQLTTLPRGKWVEPQLTLPRGKWVETVEDGKTVMNFVLDDV